LKPATTKKDNYNYVYNYLDHLGNVRMSYTLSELNVLTIIEENGYYPYGMKHEAYNMVLNRYKAVVSETKVELKEAPNGGQVAINDNINPALRSMNKTSGCTAMVFRPRSNNKNSRSTKYE
jgi:hypothetical protein